MADFNTALVGLLGIMVGGFFNNFVGEDYRRFLDGKALAGALAGELESHAAHLPRIKIGLEKMGSDIRSGQRLDFSEWPIPASPIFEQNAAKIGVLGATTAKEIAFVYEHLRAFRLNFHMLTKHGSDKSADWSQEVIIGCLAIISRSEGRGTQLIAVLNDRASEGYWQRPQTRKQLLWGGGIAITFLLAIFLTASVQGSTLIATQHEADGHCVAATR